MAASSSLKEYLKRYESNYTEEDKKKKKKKKKTRTESTGVLIVDEDPVWQKPVKLDEEEDNESPDEEPQVDEDIEVKRMKRLEQLRASRPYHAISEDGSGWISVSDGANQSDFVKLNPSNSSKDAPDMSPPREHRRRYDSLSPEPPLEKKQADSDLSPPRMRGRRHDSLSPTRRQRPSDSSGDTELSPPRQQRLPARRQRPIDSSGDIDLSPPRQQRRRHDSEGDTDMSPPRRRQKRLDDISAPLDSSNPGDLSPPRRERHGSPNMSKSRNSRDNDLSPPRKSKEQSKTGLVTGQEIKEEILRKKHEELLKFKQMDPSVTGQGAELIYRDKLTGARVSKDEYFKSQKKGEKPKEEKKLEWGKGLAQKREAEAKQLELELEKDKPFARSRDDADLDKMLKDAVRWGDPMAHLVKRKQSAPLLPDFGDDERMKESGFVIPQEIPSHSWIKRGLDAAPNRYGIKPGRHWDGVDRSNGYEKELFKRMNEKRATEREAYLWSVSDM